ncbi:kinesin-like protein KIP1 [Acyrthosiphon pisum]|uniref:Uncharacterized protein n=1 Tax=Acyrthosiphon pisum TaxID=7029 RepID=A0A8R2AB77_ACYPI|nr:kinesin-like protein KIP1 [Acyrthosiphon pisum]|eukprot:XP_003248222.1 PREDICTED: kinesin-like protein KIP1 [Acyrthosiphon pisum]
MWLNSFFSKPKDNVCEATVQNCTNEDKVDEDKVDEDKVDEDKADEDNVNKDKVTEEKVNEVKICEESVKILSKNEEERIIKTDLQERVEEVKIVHENIQAIQNKQDLNCSTDTTNTKKNEEINNCKIEAVLRIIPVIEKNLQTLTKKVSCLSGLINMKQLNAKIETDQNIILNNSNINSPNSFNKLNIVDNTTTLKKKDITLGKISKKNKKTTKNKLSVTKKKKTPENPEKAETNLTKTITENNQVTNPENLAVNNTKSIDQLTNYLDGRLECFFTKIQSALSQFKIDKINENCEIMVHLSGLDNKMNTNEMNIDKLMSNVEQLSKKNECEIIKKQSSIKTENQQDLQKSIDDIKMCIDYLIQPDGQQTQQCTDTPNTNKNIKNKCTSDRCVCQLVNNANAANIKIINSKDGHNQLKYGDIILCEFLKAKLTMEMFKRSDQQNKVPENQFSNKDDNKKISHLSVCSKKLDNISNNCVENQIDDNTACNLSVCSIKTNHISNNSVENQIIDNKMSNITACSKKSNQLKNNCVQKQNEEQIMNQVMSQLCPKQSIHHFSKSCVENEFKLNQPTSKKSVCEKNQICEFLASQPIPEWIRRSQNIVASDNPCKNSPTNCHLNSSKLYSIERIDRRDKNNTDCAVYEITQKQDIQEENKKCRAFKEHTLVPCNSLNNKPSNGEQ